ncbi:coiled-coil domain-containing protein 137 isoform X3 [Cavia porcellus]|uniref:coiled-coil domain-containing protein 137 isoform X3 n=1 Tax=Cavia porcellus TaxID=10141 RepID=UPI0003512BFF
MAGAGQRAVAPPGRPGNPGQPQARRRWQRQWQQPRGQQKCSTWEPGQCSKEKKKVNCKPKNQDEQEIPFRLREIMKSREEMKKPLSFKKRKKEAQVAFRNTLEKEAKGMEPDIMVPKFRQRKGESDRAYLQRMEQETQHVLFLSKNQIDRQPEVQAAPKKEKSERKKAYCEVWRGCLRATRADCPAQEEHKQKPAWQDITDAEDAFEPWWCVPEASEHLTGQAADCEGREGAGCAGLPGPEETATAAAGVTTTAAVPHFPEEG